LFLGVEADVGPWARHFGTLQLLLVVVEAGLRCVERRLRAVLRQQNVVAWVLAVPHRESSVVRHLALSKQTERRPGLVRLERRLGGSVHRRIVSLAGFLEG